MKLLYENYPCAIFSVQAVVEYWRTGGIGNVTEVAVQLVFNATSEVLRMYFGRALIWSSRHLKLLFCR